MDRSTAVFFGLVAMVGLRGEGCGSSSPPARTYCEGDVIRVDLKPGYCAPIAKCNAPATASGSDRWYGRDYLLEVMAGKRVDHAAVTLSPSEMYRAATDLPSWMLLGGTNPGGFSDNTPAPLEAARICARTEAADDLALEPSGELIYAILLKADRPATSAVDPSEGTFQVTIRVANDLGNEHYEVEAEIEQGEGIEQSSQYGWIAHPDTTVHARAALLDGDPTTVEYEWSLLPEGGTAAPMATGSGARFEFSVPGTCPRDITAALQIARATCGKNVLVQVEALQGGTAADLHQAQIAVTPGPLAVIHMQREAGALSFDASASVGNVRSGAPSPLVGSWWVIRRTTDQGSTYLRDLVDGSIDRVTLDGVAGTYVVRLVVADAYDRIHESVQTFELR